MADTELELKYGLALVSPEEFDRLPWCYGFPCIYNGKRVWPTPQPKTRNADGSMRAGTWNHDG